MAEPDHIEALIERYLVGEATEAERYRLADWLGESEDHRVRFLAEVDYCRTVRGVLVGEERESAISASCDSTASFMAMLHDLEPHGPVEPIHLPEDIWHLHHPPPQSRPLAFRLALLGGAFAAALVLTALVYFQLPGQNTPPALVAEPSAPAKAPAVAMAPALPVATLTAAEHADWAVDPFAIGETFYPGQTITLTRGVAELTTRRGGRALLQAPCTVQFIDHDNGLRLIRGRLVGIVETDDAKGMLVRTRHMDVTDLGTRFGVDVSGAQRTEVHVLQGEVQVARPATEGAPASAAQPMSLLAGQAVAATAQDAGFEPIATDSQRFAALLPEAIDLPGSGVGLLVNQTDPAWQIIAVNGQPLATPLPLRVSEEVGHMATQANDPDRAQWLMQMSGPLPEPNEQNTYTFATRLVIPDGVDLARTSIQAVVYFDNFLGDLRFNGRSLADTAVGLGTGHPRVFSATLAELGLRHGSNAVHFDVINHRRTPMGVRVSWALQETGLAIGGRP